LPKKIRKPRHESRFRRPATAKRSGQEIKVGNSFCPGGEEGRVIKDLAKNPRNLDP